MIEEPQSFSVDQAFDELSAKGHALERLGKSLQDPDTKLSTLLEEALAGGLRVDISFRNIFS